MEQKHNSNNNRKKKQNFIYIDEKRNKPTKILDVFGSKTESICNFIT